MFRKYFEILINAIINYIYSPIFNPVKSVLFTSRRESSGDLLEELIRSEDKTFRDVTNIYIKQLDWRQLKRKTKLKLYAYYKQATSGDNRQPKPRGWRWSERIYKWKAWKHLSGMERSEAERRYIRIYYHQREQQLAHHRNTFVKDTLKPVERTETAENNNEISTFGQFFEKSFTAVLPDQIPTEMVNEYLRTHGTKYRNAGLGKTLTDLKAEEVPRTVTDTEFESVLFDTLFGRLIVPMNSVKGNHYTKLFGLEDSNEVSEYFICDTTIIRGFEIHKEDGYWMGPSVVLFKGKTLHKIATENLCETKFPPEPFPSGIENLVVLLPEDGLAWEMAKLHTLANLSSISTMGTHPLEHFTIMDPIAVSNIVVQNKTPEFKQKSLFCKILTEHTYLQIQVNSNVLFAAQSVTNASDMPYYPWNIRANEKFGILNIFRLITEGWENHPIYVPGPNLFEEIPFQFGGYGRLLSQTKKIVDEFVNDWFDFYRNDPLEIRFTQQFLEETLRRLPEISFLRPILLEVLRNGKKEDMMDQMKLILAHVIYGPIEHSVDHRFLQKSFFQEVCHQIMRKPTPLDDKSTDPVHINNYVKDVNHKTDRAKHVLAQYFSFHHYPSRTFDDFFFQDGGYWAGMEHQSMGKLKAAEEKYLQGLAKLYAGDDSPLSYLNLATSIQY